MSNNLITIVQVVLNLNKILILRSNHFGWTSDVIAETFTKLGQISMLF